MRVLTVIIALAQISLLAVDLGAQQRATDPPAAVVASNDGPTAPVTVKSERDRLLQRLDELVLRFQDVGRSAEAELVRNWPIDRPADRQLVFLRPLELPNAPAVDQNDDDLWQEFLQWRQDRAAMLFEESAINVKAGHVAEAYQRLFEILRDDPQHAAARKIVGFKHDPIRVSPGKTRHDKLKWKAGEYWRAHSSHFTITTNHSKHAALAMAQRLEQLHQVWRQLFVMHWTTQRSVKQAFAGRALVWPARRRHNVVLFADRAQFIRHLKPEEPQIELAMGVYRDRVRTSYFYEGETDLQSTWMHEATHQLFQETVPARPGAGATVDFWMIEAVAMYLESTQFQAEYATVGGGDSARLEVARHRALEEGFYVPLHVISELGRSELQQHHDIRRLYTQSAGLAHFLMDDGEGRFRPGFIRAVSDLYRSPGKNDPLWKKMRVSSSKLDAAYQEFLRNSQSAG